VNTSNLEFNLKLTVCSQQTQQTFNCHLILLTGLYRLEQLHNAINNSTYNLEIDWLRITNVDNCYVSLRRIDNSPGDKHIVLDFGTQAALESVLRQV
jgi:hypothetical protein